MTIYHADSTQVSLASFMRIFNVFCVAAACFLGATALAQDDPYAEPEEQVSAHPSI